MPKAKERKPDDKIKSQGKRKSSKPVQDQARRVITAKMRKELAQQKRNADGSTGEATRETSPTAEAVGQVEQTAGAAVCETNHRTKQGVSKAVTRARQERRKIKERQDQPKEKDQPPEPPAPETSEVPAPEMPDVPAPRPDRPAPKEQAGRTPPRSKPQPTGKTVKGPTPPKEKPAPSPPSPSGWTTSPASWGSWWSTCPARRLTPRRRRGRRNERTEPQWLDGQSPERHGQRRGRHEANGPDGKPD